MTANDKLTQGQLHAAVLLLGKLKREFPTLNCFAVSLNAAEILYSLRSLEVILRNRDAAEFRRFCDELESREQMEETSV